MENKELIGKCFSKTVIKTNFIFLEIFKITNLISNDYLVRDGITILYLPKFECTIFKDNKTVTVSDLNYPNAYQPLETEYFDKLYNKLSNGFNYIISDICLQELKI